MAQSILHDAQKGFYDIKALPAFYPSYTTVLISTVLVTLALLLSWLGLRYLRRRAARTTEPERDWYQETLEELRTLTQQTAQITPALAAERAAHCSLLFRRGLSLTLQLPAVENTTKEIEAGLLPTLDARTSHERAETLSREILVLLQSLERASYSGPRFALNAEQIAQKAQAALDLLEELPSLSHAEPSSTEGASSDKALEERHAI